MEKIVHFIWDLNPLSFFNYISVVSFIKYHPDWKIWIWRINHISPKTWTTKEHQIDYKGPNYFPKLESHQQIVLKDIDDLKPLFPFIERKQLKGVHLSDYSRYAILSEYGGVYSDFDIIYLDTIEKHIEIDANFVIPYKLVGKYFPIGFIYSQKKSITLKYILELCENNYNQKEYQSLGRKLFNNQIFTKLISSTHHLISLNMTNFFKEKVHIIPGYTYLKYDYIQIKKFYEPGWKGENLKDCFGIHWFNGLLESKIYQNDISSKIFKNVAMNRIIQPYLQYQ